ncbi:DUF6343 family protein [Actinacidiphila paucisporea]|uniref:Uncharacterized protein n=1 Tax=Actinacidiphila paucisporea TaxID=310782 RepID=A0A1M7NZW7_9ACTN|nr:DUF6343 family protein [Actinacidiphila paucisporea]SHN09725.1 hypothetical protein SAMN05216499_12085 [Actinacidiphila paucisporea]
MTTTPVRHRRETSGERRSGTEPTKARSPQNLRLRLCLIYAPVFLIGAGLFAWWAADSVADDKGILEILAAICALFFVIAAANAAVLMRRARRAPRPEEDWRGDDAVRSGRR